MKNLAGITDADAYIRKELETAIIPVVLMYDKHLEVPYTIGAYSKGSAVRS